MWLIVTGTSAHTSLAQEVRDLRSLVFEALNALRKAGASKDADKIQRKLDKHPTPDSI